MTPHVATVAPGERPYLGISFPAAPPDRPYVIFNMVGSLDGKAVIENTEQGLGSAADKARMQELRAHADAVMNGANTLRLSGASSRVREPELQEWRAARGKPGHPLGVLITTQGAFEFRGPYFQPPPDGLGAVIMATNMTPERRAEIEARGPAVLPIAPDGSGLRDGLRWLRRERGVETLLCEGGATVLRGLVDAGCADELFLTLSPALVGGEHTLTIFEGPAAYEPAEVPRLELVSALANPETNELYLRYRFAHSASRDR